VACSNNVAILQRFQDITTFTAYVTACDLQKSLTFDNAVKVTYHVRFWLVCKHIVHDYVLYFLRYGS